MGTFDLLEQRDALLVDLAKAYEREDALKRERDAAIAERDALRAEVEALRASGRVTADDMICVCMGDCGAILYVDKEDGTCAGCGCDTAVVLGIGSSEAVLEAFRARDAAAEAASG